MRKTLEVKALRLHVVYDPTPEEASAKPGFQGNLYVHSETFLSHDSGEQ